MSYHATCSYFEINFNSSLDQLGTGTIFKLGVLVAMLIFYVIWNLCILWQVVLTNRQKPKIEFRTV